jgi:hypothetical protein
MDWSWLAGERCNDSESSAAPAVSSMWNSTAAAGHMADFCTVQLVESQCILLMFLNQKKKALAPLRGTEALPRTPQGQRVGLVRHSPKGGGG